MKNKQTLTLSLIIFLLFIMGYLVIFNDKKSSINQRKPIHNFQVSDTSSITRIVISDKSPSSVKLTKNTNNQWKINNTHNVRKNAVDILLSTLASMEMKSFVPKAAEQNVLKKLSTSGTQVKVYKKNRLIKHFYVGGEPQDLLGTYMMIHGSSKPFVVHIPGFNGFLSSRFFTDELLWKNRTFCNLSPNKIQSIEINYGNDLSQKGYDSFKIHKIDSKNYMIKKTEEKENYTRKPADFSKSEIYFSLFKNLQVEAFVNDMSQQKVDSILKKEPVFEITITDINKNINTLKAFYKKPKKNQTDNNGLPLKNDVDRLFALVNNSDFAIIQYYVFNNILKSKSDFYKSRRE